MGSVRFRSALF